MSPPGRSSACCTRDHLCHMLMGMQEFSVVCVRQLRRYPSPIYECIKLRLPPPNRPSVSALFFKYPSIDSHEYAGWTCVCPHGSNKHTLKYRALTTLYSCATSLLLAYALPPLWPHRHRFQLARLLRLRRAAAGARIDCRWSTTVLGARAVPN